MNTKDSLLICYDYFYPAYKAGGPIQSLTNLVLSLQHEYEAAVITGGYDLNAGNILDKIKTGCWTSILLPQSASPINVWYAEKGSPDKSTFRKCIAEVKPSVIYLNGMFSFRFVIIPLLAARKSAIKIVVCPRGMLQAGALAGKSFKKKLYLSALKMAGLVKHITWHATNEEEEQDIKKVFGKEVAVIVAANIPKKPVDSIKESAKTIGQLRLVYLSLVAEKKNLLQVIELVTASTENISLDIYGPVKDEGYWKKCELAMAAGQGKVNYIGDVLPEKVQETFSNYDASILLTKGENFGHALYESLSAGRPLITSYFTPWNKLAEKKGGWNVDIENEKSIADLLQQLCAMSCDEHQLYCEGAYKLAKDYYNDTDFKEAYRELFG